MRVILESLEANRFFNEIKKASGYPFEKISRELNVSPNTFKDWRRGLHSNPDPIINIFERLYKIKLPNNANYVNEHQLKIKASRTGALNRYRKYGNPGTVEGRRKSGLHSLKLFPALQESDNLAEFYGIMIGDGGISTNQICYNLSNRYQLIIKEKILRK